MRKNQAVLAQTKISAPSPSQDILAAKGGGILFFGRLSGESGTIDTLYHRLEIRRTRAARQIARGQCLLNTVKTRRGHQAPPGTFGCGDDLI